MKEIRGQITVLEGERNLSTGESLTLVLEDARHCITYFRSPKMLTRNRGWVGFFNPPPNIKTGAAS